MHTQYFNRTRDISRGDNMATMTDVAIEAKVSHSTVSRVLNSKTEDIKISQNTVQNVLKAASKLNYHPNAIARGLVVNKSHAIGVALLDIHYMRFLPFATIIGGIGDVVGSHDYNLQFCTTTKEGKNANHYFMKRWLEKRVDGIVIIDQCIPDDEILHLKDSGVPFVLFDRDIPGEEINCVVMDNEGGAFQATEHFIKTGHKRIGFLFAGEPHWYIGIEKLKGYKKALYMNSLNYDKELVFSGEFSEGRTSQVLKKLMALPSRPTALLTTDDTTGVSIIKAANTMGIKVPDDLAVIGFQEEPIGNIISPALTSVRTPIEKSGELAAEMLFELLDGEKLKDNRIVLGTKLIIKKSCGCDK